MGREDTDGNLAALRVHDRAQEKQDDAWEECKAEIKEYLDEIEELACEIAELKEKAHKHDDWGIYNFSEDIEQECKEMM